VDKKDTYKVRWIKQLLSEGKLPELRVLEETDEDRFDEREMFWISFGRANGWRLTNLTDGGGGTLGLKHTEETKRKMGIAKVGNQSSKGITRVNSEETRRKMSLAKVGRHLSEEHRRKIGDAGRGKMHSLESRKKMSLLHTGKVMSDEACRKMSEAKKGKVPWNKGRKCEPLSEAHREKLSAATREWRRRVKELKAG
jgi:hypothetical protein